MLPHYLVKYLTLFRTQQPMATIYQRYGQTNSRPKSIFSVTSSLFQLNPVQLVPFGLTLVLKILWG